MSRKFTLWITSASIVVLFGVTSFSTALAVKPVDKDKFEVLGEYHFVATFTRADGDTLDHCSTFGTLVFDGEGSVPLEGSVLLEGIERCDDGASPPAPDPEEPDYSQTYVYDVSEEGVVRIYEPDPATWTQCQALDNGETLLCHGIYRDAEHLNFMAVGKRAD